jgi:hypothetical protein
MNNIGGIIVNGSAHLNPAYRISPFREEFIASNRHRSRGLSSGNIFTYFNRLFPDKLVQLTSDGRTAIGHAINILGLTREDCVTIITTTNNFYISACVTQEIEKTCSWSRDLQPNTKAIFINHEFGLYNRDIGQYKRLGIPIIEDFAHSFCSLAECGASEMQGDFLVCSFSKIFPMQAGGALLFNKNYSIGEEINDEILRYVDSNASFYINNLDDIIKKRLINYKRFSNKYRSIGVEPFFCFAKSDVPGVFCFKIEKNIDLVEFKTQMNANGIESSAFYGKSAYFVPCNQYLGHEDIDYIFEVSKYYLEK